MFGVGALPGDVGERGNANAEGSVGEEDKEMRAFAGWFLVGPGSAQDAREWCTDKLDGGDCATVSPPACGMVDASTRGGPSTRCCLVVVFIYFFVLYRY